MEIWRFNTGSYSNLIDLDRYRYPNRAVVDYADIAHTAPSSSTAPLPAPFDADGIVLHFDEPQHAPNVKLGLAADYFEVAYSNGDKMVTTQSVTRAPIVFGDDKFHLLEAPASVQEQGYDALTVRPLAGTDFVLEYADAFGPPSASTTRPSPELIADAFFYAFYRAEEADRQTTLDALRNQLQGLSLADWQTIPLSKQADLLQVPDPTLHDLVLTRFATNTVLVDKTGKPTLRYIGYTVEPTELDDKQQALRFHLFFEVLAQPARDFSTWFHIVRNTDDEQWMIYDYFPPQHTSEWPEAGVYEFVTDIRLDPGNYDISFGFWTPQDRERLNVENSDTYWINLGTHDLLEQSAP